MNFKFAIINILICTTVLFSQPEVREKLTLQQAEATALANHPRIAGALNRAEAAAQIPIEIRADAMPTVSANFTGAAALDRSRIAAGGLNNPIIYDRIAAGFTLTQVITDFGRNRDLADSARLRADSLKQLTEVARGDIVVMVDRAFYAVLRAQARLSVAEKTLAARQLVNERVSVLVKNSLRSTLDLSFAAVNVAEAKILIEAERNELQGTEAVLWAAMGITDQKQYELVDDVTVDAISGDQKTMLQQAIAQRPELATLRLEGTAAGQFAKAESHLGMPVITAIGTMGVMPVHAVEMRGTFAAAGVNVNVPIFNGHIYSARKTEASLQLRAAQNRLKDAELQVVRDVRLAYLNALSAYQRVGLTAQLQEQAVLALDLAQARYDLGLSTIVELSQAHLSVTNAELAGASARYEYLGRRADLRYQLGANR